jgi:hypothetical protein
MQLCEGAYDFTARTNQGGRRWPGSGDKFIGRAKSREEVAGFNFRMPGIIPFIIGS